MHNNKSILDNVSLKVGDRNFITVIDPNGVGKSMLLKYMVNIRQAD